MLLEVIGMIIGRGHGAKGEGKLRTILNFHR